MSKIVMVTKDLRALKGNAIWGLGEVNVIKTD